MPIINDNPVETIKAYCLRLLARREHSQKELLTKCLLKGFNQIASCAVIDDLAEHGWQSDCRYAESYAKSRIQRGYGPIAIVYELSQQGVNEVNLESIVSSEAGNWLNLLEQVYLKKYSQDTLLERCEWAKRYRFLMQRGFPGELITTLFQQLNIKLY